MSNASARPDVVLRGGGNLTEAQLEVYRSVGSPKTRSRVLRAQLGDDRARVPGMARVVPALPQDVHPVDVDFSLTHPHIDVVPDGVRVSPRVWLLSGQDVDQVAILAAGGLDVS